MNATVNRISQGEFTHRLDAERQEELAGFESVQAEQGKRGGPNGGGVKPPEG